MRQLIRVQVPAWAPLPSAPDTAHPPDPTSQAGVWPTVPVRPLEASFQLDPGRYAGDATGLNVHAQVVPDAHAATSAVAGRRLDVTIDCSAQPTPTPVRTSIGSGCRGVGVGSVGGG
jgi:hypothetical protein